MRMSPLRLYHCLLTLLSVAFFVGPASARTIRVRPGGTGDGSTWESAAGSVQAAAAAAVAGDEIWVGAGTYVGPVVLKAGVLLYGGFAGAETTRDARDFRANVTILDGDWAPGKESASVVRVDPGDYSKTAVIDGFTIRNGGGTAILDVDERVVVYVGGGIYAVKARVSNNIITGNSVDHTGTATVNGVVRSVRPGYGGGVYGGELVSNTIAGNRARRGGGAYLSYPDSARSNIVTDNAASERGGGLHNNGSPASDNVLSGNSAGLAGSTTGAGGGIFVINTPAVTRNTIRGNTVHGSGGGIAVWYTNDSMSSWGSSRVTRNIVSGNTADKDGGGIHLLLTSASSYLGAEVSSNVCAGNTAAGQGGGLWVSSPWAEITNNTLVDNTSGDAQGGGAYVTGASTNPSFAWRNAFDNNIVAYNSSGVYGLAQPPMRYVRNDVFENTGANWAGVSDLTGIEGNVAVDPQFTDRASGEYRLKATSPLVDVGFDGLLDPTDIDAEGRPRKLGVHVDVGAYEQAGIGERPRMYVKPNGNDSNDGYSWAKAKKTIQSALIMAPSEGEVWVAAGTYPEIDMPVWGVRAYGGFAGTETSRDQRDIVAKRTVIDRPTGGRNVMIRAGALQSILDGLTITGGTADLGAGIYIEGGAPLLRGLRITGNLSSNMGMPEWSYGGGVYIAGGQAVLEDCDIASNKAKTGGGIYVADGKPKFVRCRIAGNRAEPPGFPYAAQGAGIYIADGAPIVIGCTFQDNSASAVGGGVYVAGGTPVIRDNLFTGNKTLFTWTGHFSYVIGEGSAIYSTGEPLIAGNTIRANISNNTVLHAEGGRIVSNVIADNVFEYETSGDVAVICWDTDVVNNTLVGNWGRALFAEGRTRESLVANNILAWNGDDLSMWDGVSVRHNLFFANAVTPSRVIGVAGNIYGDPLFVDRAGGNYRLAADSPAINAGDDGAALTGEADRDGTPRRQGNHVDIGAYEYSGNPVTMAEVTALLRIVAGLQAWDPAAEPRADRDSNGSVDLRDALGMLQLVGG